MKTKWFMALILLTAVLVSGFSHERRRGFYLDAGLGFGGIRYGNEFDNTVDGLKKLGCNRTRLDLGFSIGWAVLQNLYVVGSANGFGDRFTVSSDFMQINTYLFGGGVKYYPLPSRKFLQLGLDMGLGKVAVSSSLSSKVASSKNGFATKISAALDLDSTMTGPALLLGGGLLLDFVEGETFAAYTVFAKFVIK